MSDVGGGSCCFDWPKASTKSVTQTARPTIAWTRQSQRRTARYFSKAREIWKCEVISAIRVGDNFELSEFLKKSRFLSILKQNNACIEFSTK